MSVRKACQAIAVGRKSAYTYYLRIKCFNWNAFIFLPTHWYWNHYYYYIYLATWRKARHGERWGRPQFRGCVTQWRNTRWHAWERPTAAVRQLPKGTHGINRNPHRATIGNTSQSGTYMRTSGNTARHVGADDRVNVSNADCHNPFSGKTVGERLWCQMSHVYMSVFIPQSDECR